MNPMAYQYGANYNFFGPRTTWYGQIAEDLNTSDNEVFYNKKAGVWMTLPSSDNFV